MTAQPQNDSSRYEVPQDWSLPDLGRVLRIELTESAPTVETCTTEYFDTADRDLSTFGATLLRRSGSSDEGWALTLPDGVEPAAHREPLGDDKAVPVVLAAFVSGVARGNPLAAVATVRSERTRHRWTDDADVVVVEIADDILHSVSSTPGAAVLDSRRELVVEPGPAGRPKLLRRLGKALTAAGATALATADGPASDLRRPPIRAGRKGKAGRKSGGAAADAIAFLTEQDAVLITQDVRLRSGQDDVHGVRVATRRARSTLKIFTALFDPAPVSSLTGELAWYAALLGEIRDRQVQRERFALALAELPDELVLGPVAATIEQHLLSEQLRAQATLREAMASDRYFGLLRASAAFVSHPPLAAGIRKEKGAAVTSTAVRRAGRKACRRLDLALSSGDDVQLHEARKAAKRARYAAELGGEDRKAVKSFKQLQDVLGEFQDSTVAADLLRRLGAATHGDPTQNGFTYGVLHEQETGRAACARKAAARWRR